jgi:hypothetical protein
MGSIADAILAAQNNYEDLEKMLSGFSSKLAGLLLSPEATEAIVTSMGKAISEAPTDNRYWSVAMEPLEPQGLRLVINIELSSDPEFE